MQSNSTPQTKPSKPYADFPLFAHQTKRWAKKVRGRTRYFGPWSDPDGALSRYLEQKDRLHSGLTPVDTSDVLSVQELARKFLTFKKLLRDGNELSLRTFDGYAAACKIIIKEFGKDTAVASLQPGQFEKLRARWVNRGHGPVTIGGAIQRIRTIFKFAFDAALLNVPIRFGPGFKKPSKKTLRITRAAKGKQWFSREEILAMLDKATGQVRAMIFLGINAGFGNGDCGKLPLAAVDLESGWLEFARPKTGVRRRCWLWPETRAALKAAIANRPTPKDDADAGLTFITKYGRPWAKETMSNPLTAEMRKLLDKIGINGGRNFYDLRRSFATISSAARDQTATDHVMGHSAESMSSLYRQEISDERLQHVCEFVRRWLFAEQSKG